MVEIEHEESSQIQKLREQGRLGSVGDPMWNGKMHECCGSKRAYYHREGCKLCVGDLKDLEKAQRTKEWLKNDAGNIVRFNKHRNRKNNDIVAAMYAMYLMGPEGKPCTLEQVGKVYKRSRQAVYDVFKSRGYQLRSKPVKEFVVIDNIKFTPRHDGYWRATTGDRKQLHVYIWEKHHGKLKEGHGIHHKDLDRANNAIGNLECLRIAEISSKHNPHLNQFTSPTGSRKWKRGRIIPRYEDGNTKNLRPAKGGGNFIPELYCAICNKIPIMETKDLSINLIIEATILELTPIPTMKLSTEGKPEKVLIMSCMGCTNRVRESVRKQLKDLGFLKRKPPEEGGGPFEGGGGVPSRR